MSTTAALKQKARVVSPDAAMTRRQHEQPPSSASYMCVGRRPAHCSHFERLPAFAGHLLVGSTSAVCASVFVRM